MNIITTSILRNHLADSLNEVSGKRDYLLLTRKGRITSALVNIDLFEDLMALKDKKYVDSIRKARAEYRSGEYFTHDDVFGDL